MKNHLLKDFGEKREIGNWAVIIEYVVIQIGFLLIADFFRCLLARQTKPFRHLEKKEKRFSIIY